MASQLVRELLARYPLVSDQVDAGELSIILSGLEQQLHETPGSVVELGCYVGTTSLFIRRMLDRIAPDTNFHVYDSFVGLPEKTGQDASPVGEQFKTGELAISRKAFEMQFKKAGLRLPHVHKGWFADLTLKDIPDNITFAYLDGDYYESIKDSLHIITPKLLPGAVIVVDDYANEALPGTAAAVDEWATPYQPKIRVENSLAIIHT